MLSCLGLSIKFVTLRHHFLLNTDISLSASVHRTLIGFQSLNTSFNTVLIANTLTILFVLFNGVKDAGSGVPDATGFTSVVLAVRRRLINY